METSSPSGSGCECLTWARLGGKYWTDHHERCERHVEGSILVWKLSADGSHYFEHDQQIAAEMKKEGCTREAVVVQAKDYEALPEFTGF